MARILLGLSTGFRINDSYEIPGFYDQFVSAMVEMGNDVLVYIPNYFQKDVFGSENVFLKNVDEKPLRKEIKEFEPELVIAFNNKIYYDILNIVDCPVALYDADTSIYWSEREKIKENLDRYYFLRFVDKKSDNPIDVFGAKSDRVFNIKSATNLKNTNSKKDKNISFIGTCFSVDDTAQEVIKKTSANPNLKKALKMIWDNPYVTKDEIIKNLNDENFIKEFLRIDEKNYFNIFAGEKRTKALLNVLDLGLDLYGYSIWPFLVEWFPSLVSCYHQEHIYSAKQNEEIYNTSKICLNINHEQASEGMPFRICDILASGGCLVTSFSPYYKKVFGNDVDIPIFKDSFEAREICKKLLNDEKLRLEIVEASNKAIDKDWRFESRFKQIGDIFNIDMVDKNKEGSLKILYPQYKKDCSIYIKREANKALKGLIKTLPYFIAKKVLK